MISSTLTEQKTVALLLFWSIKTGLFKIERALQVYTRAVSLNKAGCLTSGHHWQVPLNPEQLHFNG